jgi:D-3-phosphoglycerate dehydrogenase
VARADFPDLEAERRILGAVGAEVVDGRFAPEAELAALCREADAVLTDYFVLRRPLIEAMTRCRVICQYGVGLDHVDLEAATERGIVVTHTPTACTDEVVDHALALLLCLWRKIIPLRDAARSGRWDYNAADPLFRIRGRVLGVVGLGRIGRTLAAKAAAIGFTIVGHDPLVPMEQARVLGVEPCDLPTLLGRADAVSLHAPLTPATRHLIGARELGLMKPTALLVNTARGGLVDQAALLAALRRGRLAGAALDVLEREPPAPDEPLLRLPNVVVTPHAAFYSRESLAAVQTQAAEAVAAVLAGRRPPVVANPAVLGRPA